MFLTISAIIILALTLIHLKIRYSREGRLLAKIPGPSGLPVIGNVLDVLVPLDQFWKLFRVLDRQHFPLYKLYFFDVALVNILEADDAEVILSSTQHIEKSSFYSMLECWFGTGLLFSTGSKWHRQRKILTPAFHFNVLQKYLEIILENDDKIVKHLRDQGESVQSLMPLLSNYSLNIVCEAAMGISLQDKQELQAKYRRAVHEMGDILIYRFMRPWLYNPTIFNMTSLGRKQREALKILHEFSRNIIKERKEYHEKTEGRFLKDLEFGVESEKETIDEVFGYRKKRLAMLDLLIAAQRNGEPIDDTEIREEVDTFVYVGHDTTAINSCFTLLLLAEHKDVQDRIRLEVSEVLDGSSGKLGMQELQQLTYLEMCIKESLRLYPSAPFILRNLNEDLHLKNYIVPKGTSVDVHIFQIHRDPRYWPDPEKFDPERFLPERIQGRHPFSYIPFSGGPRNCIGQKFAMMELKALVAHIIHNFYLEPIDLLAHQVPIVPDAVLRPSQPVHVKFIPITK